MARNRKRRIKPLGWFVIFVLITFLLIVAIYSVSKLIPFFSKQYFYQQNYAEYVEKYSQEYDLDPLYVYSVIKVESDFNPDATSSAGATGLMQIMPIAFEEVAEKLGEADEVSYSDMKDPETNIRYGCYILRQLLDEFGDYRIASAAYNGGIGNVEGWVEEGIISIDNFDVEAIPLSETRHYVRKIVSTYENYKNLYE
ncbi:MAG: lytic transglycosylase domain-containing protein [Ruminococcus sp.]|nr:lytic transglycosylase domain-containing protein [Ruminococcus sp.]